MNEYLEGLSRISGDLSPEVRDGLSRFLRNKQLDPEVYEVASRELQAIERSLMYWGHRPRFILRAFSGFSSAFGS